MSRTGVRRLACCSWLCFSRALLGSHASSCLLVHVPPVTLRSLALTLKQLSLHLSIRRAFSLIRQILPTHPTGAVLIFSFLTQLATPLSTPAHHVVRSIQEGLRADTASTASHPGPPFAHSAFWPSFWQSVHRDGGGKSDWYRQSYGEAVRSRRCQAYLRARHRRGSFRRVEKDAWWIVCGCQGGSANSRLRLQAPHLAACLLYALLTARTLPVPPAAQITTHACDAASEDAIREICERAITEQGQLDVFFANAAIATGAPISATDGDDVTETLRVNVLRWVLDRDAGVNEANVALF